VVQTYQSTYVFYIHGHDRSESDFKTFTEIKEKTQRNLSFFQIH